ncbi:hypothetical protein MHYMCMPSP_00764 [Hyalomma marginatum]|uniref:Uncharacterized protein n=1 Tax=Hyalomma marginatum TaxID=34627 RepID=A0A8S4BTR1_9ACAR|nr:hypothetical protein MHYMCMPASI_00159 [Hyalomma marginatum]CAG7592978.1 hypothetical protein MHYMCMPSP_00764 [Hyalomma marginatum]
MQAYEHGAEAVLHALLVGSSGDTGYRGSAYNVLTMIHRLPKDMVVWVLFLR